jgi:hypothetical protein
MKSRRTIGTLIGGLAIGLTSLVGCTSERNVSYLAADALINNVTQEIGFENFEAERRFNGDSTVYTVDFKAERMNEDSTKREIVSYHIVFSKIDRNEDGYSTMINTTSSIHFETLEDFGSFQSFTQDSAVIARYSSDSERNDLPILTLPMRILGTAWGPLDY